MHNNYFRTNDFAKACGVTKATLLHYDEIDLFKPDYIAENGYRYYSDNQIYRFETISFLKDVGMSLPEIKAYLDDNTPRKNLSILKYRKLKAEKESAHLCWIERVLHTTIESMEKADSLIFDTPVLTEQNEPKYLFAFKAEQRDETIAKVLPVIRTYMQQCLKNYLNQDFSMGEIVLHKDIVNGSFKKTYGCYRLEQKIDSPNCFEKPAGLYLSMNHRGFSSQLSNDYQKLKLYADENGYTIVGNAYEEDVSTVLSEKDRSRFILHISFHVIKQSSTLTTID